MGFFQGTQERVRNSRGKRVISVWATKVFCMYNHIAVVYAKVRLNGLKLIEDS